MLLRQPVTLGRTERSLPRRPRARVSAAGRSREGALV